MVIIYEVEVGIFVDYFSIKFILYRMKVGDCGEEFKRISNSTDVRCKRRCVGKGQKQMTEKCKNVRLC